MKGAAIATLVSYIIVSCLRYFISNKLMHISYEWNRIIKILMLSGVLFLFSKLIIIERPIISFLIKVPLTLALPFLLILIKFYDEKEKLKVQELTKNFLRQIQAFFAKKQSSST